jgi:alpha-L-fucosidase
MEPDIIFFSDAGPGVRWVGNEKGIAGETNWNMITPDTLYAGKAGIEGLLSRGHENGTAWIPAEVDVSIRKGWFYHAEEDSLVKTPETLFDIYMTSVGRGSTLLLNVPPDKRGLIHENDVAALRGFRKKLDAEFADDKARTATVGASEVRGSAYDPRNLIDINDSTYWATADGVLKASIEFEFPSSQEVSYVVLQEYIQLGQRVKSFSIEAMIDGKWQQLFEGTTIGYKRIVPVSTQTSKLRINIRDSRACPVISNIAIY